MAIRKRVTLEGGLSADGSMFVANKVCITKRTKSGKTAKGMLCTKLPATIKLGVSGTRKGKGGKRVATFGPKSLSSVARKAGLVAKKKSGSKKKTAKRGKK